MDQTKDNLVRHDSLYATLLLNFGPDNNRGYPVLITGEEKPTEALIKTLEYFLKWQERAQAAEHFLDVAKPHYKTMEVGAAGMVAFEKWKRIVDNCNLRKEFKREQTKEEV